jgi:hypothetical protein
MTPEQPEIAAAASGGLAQARALAARGADAAAMLAYLDILRRDPTDLAGLLELARLALRGGHRSAACTAYEQAILAHPADPTARVNLGNLLTEAGEFEAARGLFAQALLVAPRLAPAHQGLARVLAALGDAAGAAAHRAAGFCEGWLAPQPFHGVGPGVRVLLLVCAAGGNIPTGGLLDDTLFAVTALYADVCPPGATTPPHDLVFNAIGDADLCRTALENARRIVAASPAPVINPPEAVARTGRAENARRLAGLADAMVPEVRPISRADLLADRERVFPLLVRAPGFNTGQHFVRVERADDLADAIAALPGDDLLAIEPLDTRGPDGRFRKYRVMLIGGALYPLHLALSADWKVHYFTADMARSAAHRAEERAFLDDMAGVLGPRAVAALRAIGAALGLDYAGVDFALAPDGRLMLFEANAGMVIAPPGPEPIWDYRRAPTQRALAAVKALLLSRAAAAQ